METRPGPVSPRPSGARLLPLCQVPPSSGQSPLWCIGAGRRVGRSDHDPTLSGQSECSSRRLETYAGTVRRSRKSDCSLLGLSQRTSGANYLSPVPPWGLSTRQRGHRILQQVHLSCPLETLGGVVVRGQQESSGVASV